jgi:hypothetical protein
MSDSGDRKPGGFDGEEATEVLPLPRAPNKTIEMRAPPTFDEPPPPEDEDGPLRKYLAPRVLAVQPVPEQGPEDHKIVINVRTPPPADAAAVEAPASSAAAEVTLDAKMDADRARRRAPTVRIARGTLAAQGMLPNEGSIDVSFDDESDAPGSAVSRSGAERREGDRGKLIAVGVAFTLLVAGGAMAALVLTGTLRHPGVNAVEPAPRPAPTPASSDVASSEPAASAPPTTALPSAGDPPPLPSGLPSASTAPSTPTVAVPPRRFTPPPRPYNRPPTKVSPTTL